MCAEGRGSSAEALPSRKGLRKLMFSETPAINSLRSLFAEDGPEIQPKNLRGSSRRRRKQKRLQALLAEGSPKGFAEGVVSVVKLYRNKNDRSFGFTLTLNPKPKTLNH